MSGIHKIHTFPVVLTCFLSSLYLYLEKMGITVNYHTDQRNCLSVLYVNYQGDLGAIDEKYDIAISSSCGALDYIVVDTIDTAQECVNFLKSQGIGVATFIALDKVSIGFPEISQTVDSPLYYRLF